MYKYFKAKFIIPALILLCGIILLLMYFVGALKVGAATITTRDFSIDGFTDVNDIKDLNLKKLVAKNQNYKMYFNEDTTVITVVALDSYGNETSVVYNSAIPSYYSESDLKYISDDQYLTLDQSEKIEGKKVTSGMQSNFVIYYLADDGTRVTTTLNAIDNSIAFKNDLTGTIDKHYSIKYIPEDNAVQVCYEVGKFGSSLDYFPTYVTKQDLADTLRGNLIPIEDRASLAKGLIVYKNAYCYGKSVAKYLYDNGLADQINVKNSYGAEFDPDDEEQTESTEYFIQGISYDAIYGYGEYCNCEGSPVIVNPFFTYRYYDFVTKCYTPEDNSTTYVDADGNSVPFWYSKGLTSTQIPELYAYLYTSFDEIYCDQSITYKQAIEQGKYITLKDENGDAVVRGGFQARDDEGNFLYEMDDDGNYLRDDYDRLIPVQAFYSVDLANEQNAYFGIEAAQLPVFQIAIEFKLTDSGLVSTILNESLVDSSNYTSDLDPKFNSGCELCEIVMLPYLNSCFLKDTETADGNVLGQIVIPDGSGATINFNNGANDRKDAAYKALIYGGETSHLEVDGKPTDTQKVMFPMFGYFDYVKGGGTMAIMEEGQSMSFIYADTWRDSSTYNIAYFQSKLREVESVVTAYGYYRNAYTKYAAKLNPTDYVYNYNFLSSDELDYSTLAKKYQAYLMDRFGLEYHDETLDHPVVDINFMGAYRHYVLTLGVIYYTKSPLTTFKEAQAIVEELNNEGITNMTVSYKGWTQDALEVKARKNVKVSSALGSKKDLKEFEEYLYSNGISFYPEVNISYNKGYKFSFGVNKYTSRGVGNVVTKMYDFDLAKLQYNKQSKPSYILSPKYFLSLSSKMSKSFLRVGSTGVYLSDLGNSKIGDYHKGKLLYADEGLSLIDQTIKYWSEDYKVQLSAPFDYAIKYATSIVNAPFTTTQYPIVDDCIPFYQLVLSGIVDYSSVIINGTSDNSVDWFLAKAVESGSNLYYQLAEEDNSVLLETDYTQYYRVNYAQWKSTILSMYNALDGANISSGKLVKHQTIDLGTMSLSYVEYDNGIKYYVNTNSRSVVYKGQTINAYSWVSAN